MQRAGSGDFDGQAPLAHCIERTFRWPGRLLAATTRKIERQQRTPHSARPDAPKRSMQNAGKPEGHSKSRRACQVSRIHNSPASQQLASRYLSVNSCHDHQSVSGEQLCTANNDQKRPGENITPPCIRGEGLDQATGGFFLLNRRVCRTRPVDAMLGFNGRKPLQRGKKIATC